MLFYLIKVFTALCQATMETYPRSLGNYSCSSVFAERCAAVMHQASVIISSAKGVNRRSGVLVKISLRPWNKLSQYTCNYETQFSSPFQENRGKDRQTCSPWEKKIKNIKQVMYRFQFFLSTLADLAEWKTLNIFSKLNLHLDNGDMISIQGIAILE